MQPLDWIVVGVYCAIIIGIGIFLSKRASKGTDDYFLSGRSLPWWLAGTSIVATSFASDTPLAVTGWVRQKGIWGNWIWWGVAISHVLAIFFFSRLWRRSGAVTEVELTEMRYSGKPAAILRGTKAIFFGIGFGCYGAGAWVMTGLVTIMMVCVPDLYDAEHPERSKLIAIGVCSLIAIIYATLAGFWGVVATDFLQFILAMVGAIILAGVAIHQIGGFESFWGELGKIPEKTQFLPEVKGGFWDSPISMFLAFILVQWWAWKNSDGGGLAVQRMLACKNERESMFSVLWFAVAHYALRCWPWILVALCSLILLTDADLPVINGKVNHEAAYPKMVMTLPLAAGLKGLLLASFLAAFMSTIDTYMNWGASYMVNDFYKRFFIKDASERHYVWVSRIIGVLIVVGAGWVAFNTESIGDAFNTLLSFTAGIGVVNIARWFWWRTNAWSELSVMASSIGLALVKSYVAEALGIPNGSKMFTLLYFIVGTGLIWIPITLLTAPSDKKTLMEFYRKCRPPKLGWGPIARECPEVVLSTKLSQDLFMWGVGTVCVFGLMFGIGKLLLGSLVWGGVGVGAGIIALLAVIFYIRKTT